MNNYKVLIKAIDIQPNNISAIHNLATCYKEMGNTSQVEELQTLQGLLGIEKGRIQTQNLGNSLMSDATSTLGAGCICL